MSRPSSCNAQFSSPQLRLSAAESTGAGAARRICSCTVALQIVIKVPLNPMRIDVTNLLSSSFPVMLFMPNLITLGTWRRFLAAPKRAWTKPAVSRLNLSFDEKAELIRKADVSDEVKINLLARLKKLEQEGASDRARPRNAA
jgi:hypothetical protein